MPTINESFIVLVRSKIGPVTRMELTIKTRGKGLANAVAITQSILNNEGAILDNMSIESIEKLND